LALTEPGAGSDALGSMRMSARRDGDHYLLSGTKIFITNGPVADVLVTYAKTAPELGTHGISAFIIEKDFPASAWRRSSPRWAFAAARPVSWCSTTAACRWTTGSAPRTPASAVVMTGLDLERATIAPICLGIAERALQLSIEHAKTRKQFGRPIAEFEMIQGKIADMYVWVETMRGFVYRVLAAVDHLGAERGGRGELHALSAASVMYAAETMGKVLADALQIHGGSGYIWESEVNRLYRAIKMLEIGAGTTEVRKLIISRELLATSESR
jgi:isovaleryl-CoA dehydrogenase